MTLINDVLSVCQGQWHDILNDYGIEVPRPGKHGPCPVCGGKDRFHFDDKQGRGTWHCRKCEPHAGDGLALAAKVGGTSMLEAAKRLAPIVGVQDSNKFDRSHIEANRMRAAQNNSKRAAEDEKAAKSGAAKASALWRTCASAPTDHPYLSRKQIQAHGAKVLTKNFMNGKTEFKAGDLVVPAATFSDDGSIKIQSLELIGASKQGLQGAKRAGCFYPLDGSASLDNAVRIYVAEGFATAATIREATGAPTVCCFSSGQLKRVCDSLAQRYDAQVIICADRDPSGDGEEKAKKSGYKYLLVPDHNGTDWNDYACEGHDVADALMELEQKPEMQNVIPHPAAQKPVTAKQMASLGIIEWIDQKSNGKPKGTYENFVHMLDCLDIPVRYNLISKEVEISIPGSTFTVDNASNAALAMINSVAAKFDFPQQNIRDYILTLADQNAYNPVAAWVEAAAWDGVDRIEELAKTLDPECLDTAHKLLRRWLISAVAALFNPTGVSSGGVLVLQGDQGLGKTSWFWHLCNGNREWGKESAILNPSDRDSVKQCISYWLVELGELDATFRKADIAALKGFITRDYDEFRRAYAATESRYPRRTVFFASVNPKGYLHDDTGNRRFWTIPCGSNLNYDHNLDMQQIWAQAHALFLSGEKWHLTRDEMALLEEVNDDHHATNPIEELITKYFDMSLPPSSRTERMSATEVLIHIGYERPTNGQAIKAGAALRKLLGVSGPQKSGSSRYYELPPARTLSR